MPRSGCVKPSAIFAICRPCKGPHTGQTIHQPHQAHKCVINSFALAASTFDMLLIDPRRFGDCDSFAAPCQTPLPLPHQAWQPFFTGRRIIQFAAATG